MIYKVLDISSFTEDDYNLAYNRQSEERRKKIDRYKHPEDKRRSVFAYTLMLDMLSEFTGKDTSLFEFEICENGKPCLKNFPAHFNISHSGNFVACAVSSEPVGIDIEIPRTPQGKLLSRICTEDETKYIMQGEGEDSDRRFIALWTAKEAYLKYTGKGLSGGINTVQTADKNGIFQTFATGEKLLCEVTDSYCLSVVYTK